MKSHDRSILDSLSKEGKAALLARSIEKSYVSGDVLWMAGDNPAGLTIVLEGKVRLIRALGGRQAVIHSGETGATLGEIPFFTQSTYPATAIASEPTRCLLITHEAFDEALHVDPSLAYVLLESLSKRVQRLVERVGSLTYNNVTARLAQYLIDRARDSNAPTFSLGVTQGELADELGTVREVIVRALRQLKDSGAISSREYGRYSVANAGLLREAAGID